MESDPNEIIEIYRKRWEIELLFKQIKQNFPLKYFYGESANAIKIQIWVNTDLGDAYSQSAPDGNEKGADTFLEFLRTCHHDEDYAYVLCGFLQPVQSSRKRLGNTIKRKAERRLPIIYLLRGLGITK